MGASVRTACVVIALLALACCGLPLSGQTPNPVPLINTPLVPTSVAPGGAGFTLKVNGTGFVSGSVVDWNGSPLTTTFVSSSQLTAAVPAGKIATAGTATITVSSPGDGLSNVQYLAITNTASTLTFTTINPNSVATNVEQSVPVFATGDFNGDGKLDLAVPQSTGSSVSILLGNGDGTFAPAVSYAVGSSPDFVVAADFNGDGKLDLATGNSGDGTVSILLGNDDGTFQSAKSVSLGFGAASSSDMFLAVGDFNGDGKLDLAVAYQNNFDVIAIVLGNGDGSFQAPVTYNTGAPLGNGPFGVAVGDFNGDGKLDLAISLGVFGFGGTHVVFQGGAILLGNGDGTFQAPTSLGLGVATSGIATADFNGDGKLDLVVLYEDAIILLGNGDGTFQNFQTEVYDVPEGTNNEMVIGDVNAAGKLDLAFSSSNPAQISVDLGNGDGTFQNPLYFNAAVPNGAIAGGDFNGDGKLDFALTNLLSADSTVTTTTVVLQGAFPSLSGSPNPLVFLAQAVGTTSSTQAITLTNSGLVPTTISSVGLAGANPGQFSQSNNCIVTLAPGATCQVSLTFAPTQQGSPTAVVSVTDDAPGSPQAISVQGSVVVPPPPPPPPPAPIVSSSPSTITFPGQYVGTSGLPQTVTVTNTGSAPLSITGATASPADFGVLSNCSNAVAVGSSCTIGVFFDPTAGGTRTGTLKITDNAGDSPQSVTLTGSGLDFSMTPGSSSATVSAGQTASYSIAVAPAGGFAASVALSCTGGPAGSACAVSPSTIALSGAAAQTAMVTVTTAAHGWVLPFEGGWPKDTRYRQTPRLLALATTFLLMVVASLFWRRQERLLLVRMAAFAALVTLGLTLTSCGGGSGSSGGGTNPQAGTYTINVTGNFTTGSTTLTHTAKLTLVVQ
jgi:FG-GAP-like repeat/Abnormal spindle-like microcephaly-assoc'd, ASPM-SPD-2-Hydin